MECIIQNKKIKESEENSHCLGFVRFDGIGDFILWLDSVPAIKCIYSEKKCILICSSLIESIAKETGLFDEIISVNIKKYKNLSDFKYHRDIRKKLGDVRCDILINPIFSRNSYLNSIVSSIYAKEKITITGDPTCKFAKENHMTDQLYDRIINVDEKCMEMKRYTDMVHQLGNNNYRSGYYKMPKITSSINISDSYFVVQLGTSTYEKSWPTDRFADVSSYLFAQSGWTCCIVGTDKQLGENFKKYYKGDLVNLIGKTSLLDLMHVIQGAKLMLGNDSSGVHIAAFSNVNAVVLAGGWDVGRFLPYDTDNESLNKRICIICKKKDCYLCHGFFTKDCKQSISKGNARLCVYEITTEEVKDRLSNYISKNNA